MGGSESSLIKIAEGLSLYGLKVAVYQHNRYVPIFGERCVYINLDILNNSTAKVVIHQRKLTRDVVDLLFPKAKHFVWCHDLSADHLLKDEEYIVLKDITIVCVSKWHRSEFKKVLKKAKVTYVYNPIHDNLYKIGSRANGYNPNKLVFLSSPHKDLDYVISVFRKLRESSHIDFELHVYNPGYIGINSINEPRVYLHGSLPSFESIKHASDALCLFMPMPNWRETFCLVAAEMNCVKVPVIAFKDHDALNETAQGGRYLCNDEKEVIDTVLSWNLKERPIVYGNPKFRLSNVLRDWIELL